MGHATTKTVASSLIFTVFLTLLIGAVTLDFNEALAQERVLGLIFAIINAFVDVGVTLWKFVSGINSCEKTVRQEDLRVAVDKNDLLIQYCKENNIEYPAPPAIDDLEPKNTAPQPSNDLVSN